MAGRVPHTPILRVGILTFPTDFSGSRVPQVALFYLGLLVFSQSRPSPTICHSERSEESAFFFPLPLFQFLVSDF
jgi:hypothetical protein